MSPDTSNLAPGYTCKVCRKKMPRGNPYGICVTTKKCRRHHRRAYNKHRAKPRKCSVCGQSITAGNTYGICQRSLKCRNEYNTVRRNRSLAPRGNRSLAHRGKCSVCGGPILRGNKLGICSRLTKCRSARSRLWASKNKSSVAAKVKRYQEKNKVKIKARRKQWWLDNLPEKIHLARIRKAKESVGVIERRIARLENRMAEDARRASALEAELARRVCRVEAATEAYERSEQR